MSSFGSQIRKRLKELEAAGEDVPRIVNDVAKGATIEAVRVATENTPPNGDAALAGTGTRTGDMAQHWSIDSETQPINGRTVLANKMQYSSYVNDGHRMDRHFVPGLMINGDKLERAPAGENTGLIVGTKTSYVPGLYMKEKAIGRYRDVVKTELDKRVKERFESE